MEMINDMFCQISCCVPYLQILELDLYRLQVSIELLPFPKLPKLKGMTIRVVEQGEDGVLALTSLVEACPNLQRFSIMKTSLFSAGKMDREVRQMAKKPHQHLEVVEIDEYHGGTSDLELVMYFIQNCVALKKLVIEATMEDEDEDEDEDGGRYRAQQQLEPRIPDGVELVIL
ncbi:FBD-like protein [Cynara cardunculus var. scolymus]|uniref:FBD-like protein n=1 Tax=Cynara cardunculus var. scolymus TaxID=59895 RepID=A0A103YIZ1_CYNCS|nr:FBD-like protein [Cynara cardunculus var. scolymus]